MALLSNRYVVAFCVPVGVLVIGALAKKIMRGPGWLRSDFYLGVELALASLASDLDYLLSLAGRGRSATGATIFLVGVLTFLFFLVAEQQDWGKSSSSRWQVFHLCVVSNLVGGGLLVAFLLYVKR